MRAASPLTVQKPCQTEFLNDFSIVADLPGFDGGSLMPGRQE
jgi:hypothetical protein